MTWQTDFSGPPRRSRAAWLGSALVAAGLNLVLFLLMPHLMDPAPPRSAIETLVPQVNVIRIKRKETKVRRNIVKPPEPKPETRRVARPKAPSPEPIKTRLTLPFEVNPRLPHSPHTLDLPSLESVPPISPGGLPDAFSMGQLDSPLTVLARTPPMYPSRARRLGIEGRVKVALLVDEAGKVAEVSITAADPPGFFEASVERCVRTWRFKPGTVGGMPVKARVETTIRFELE